MMMNMNSQDATLFQQAIQLAHSGQQGAAYSQFTALRQRGNQGNPDLLLWIAHTTPYQAEAQQMLNTVATLAPHHPGLPGARQIHAQRFQLQQPVPVVTGFGPAMHCPYCHTYAPSLIRQRVSTAGWITLAVLVVVFFPLFWIGFFIKEDYYVCSGCGVRLGGIM
jgi:hypothetical protein